MKAVYVVFSHTSTYIGKMIRLATMNKYNHVSVSFYEGLNEMYSFGRRYINSPLAGGFIVERPDRYNSPQQNISIKICRLAVSDAQYEEIENFIGSAFTNADKLIYNTFDAVFLVLHRRFRIKDAYTCLDFACRTLKFDNIFSIRQLEKQLEDNVIYEGSFCDWVASAPPSEDLYFQRRSPVQVSADTARHFIKLVSRAVYR
ncbi:MAG: hypothetical protein VB078_07395 [Clostridiaceae bacterium]|nr:hypothetical protein [Clostridiaceae bacterium]